MLAIRSFLMLYTSFFSHEIMAMKKSYLPDDFWLKTILCSYSNIIKIWLQKLSQNQLEIIKVSHVRFYLFFCFCNKLSWKKVETAWLLDQFLAEFFVFVDFVDFVDFVCIQHKRNSIAVCFLSIFGQNQWYSMVQDR